VGKTTLACKIIEALSLKGEVTAVKISKHVHQLTEKQKLIVEIPGLIIAEELDSKTTKDSSRYLQAGASRSLFVLATDDQFSFLSHWLQRNLSGIVVCETGYLGNFITPPKAFFVEGNPSEKEIHWKFPFQRTTFDGNEFHPSISELLSIHYL
jgi:hypothetical protein